MSLLRSQFPDLHGLESCVHAGTRTFARHSDLFIQIINRTPTGSGSHWLTISNIKAMDLTKEVVIYDSAFDDLPEMEGLVIASLVDIESTVPVLHVHFANIQMQRNSYDCGLFAIANATALAFGLNPINQTYDLKEMRPHLIRCLENKTMRPFPSNTRFNGKRKPVKKTIELEIFCTCRLPDTGTLYIICDNCAQEFHPACVDIDTKITDSMEFICPSCKNK